MYRRHPRFATHRQRLAGSDGLVTPIQHHGVSSKHLQAYLQEMTFRFNNRKNVHLFRDTLIQMLASENIEYRELIEAA